LPKLGDGMGIVSSPGLSQRLHSIQSIIRSP